MSREDFVSYSCFDAQGTWLLWQQLRKHLEGMEWQQGQDRFRFYNPKPHPNPTLTAPSL